MALDKSELKFLLRELKNIFATKEELKDVEIDIDPDLLSREFAHMGDDEPENEEVIWFDSGESNVSELTYENPIVDELFACIRTLQDQVKKLQEDVEYLKLYGGGGGSGGNEPEESSVSSLALEDGGLFLLEDGGLLILENAIETITESILLLENGAQFLLENGANIKLED